MLWALLLLFQPPNAPRTPLATVCEVLKNPSAYEYKPVAVVGRFERSVSLIDSLEYLAQEGCGTGRATRILITTDHYDGPAPPNDRPDLDPGNLAGKLANVRKTTALGTHKEPRYKMVDNRITFSEFVDVPNEWAVVYGRLAKIPEPGQDEVRYAILVASANIQRLTEDGALRPSN